MQYWGITDPGCVRAQNQDTFKTEELGRNAMLCIVCDGMGGAKSGNVASSLAAEVFVDEIRRTWMDDMNQAEIDQMLQAAAKLANFTVLDQGRQFEEFSGMGCRGCPVYHRSGYLRNCQPLQWQAVNFDEYTRKGVEDSPFRVPTF